MRFVHLIPCLAFAVTAFGQSPQWVEGFEQADYNHKGRITSGRDFRGTTRGYLTAAWWSEEQMKSNVLSWKTALVPAKQATTFAFIGASSVLPSEFSRGPQAKLTVNGQYAVTFTLGATRDFIWKEGGFELKYLSKRVEYPYTGTHRQFELNGDSGIYQLTVPASVVEAGQSTVLKVELLPFAGWSHGWFAVKEYRDVLKSSMANLEGEIETLREDMAVANGLTQMLATKLYPELFEQRGLKHEVIYNNGFRHVHPADLIKLQNGDILLMWREGTEHISDDGDVVMLRSKDGGKTWGDRKVIASIPHVDEREGCGIQLKDGTIIVGVFYNGLYNPDGTYMPGPEREQKLAESGKRHLGAYMLTSKDNGYTWSEPNQIETKDMPYRSLEGPTDAPIEMPDGSVLMGIIGYSPHGDMGNRSAVMIRSTDKGKTWQHLAYMAPDPSGKLGGFMEPGIVRTKTGRIVAGLRNHGTDQAIWMTHSDDDGKTWSPVKKTALIGHPVDLIELTDGRLMATYGIRPSVHTKPGGIRAAFSSDNGETWDPKTEFQIRNDFPNWDIGYPESMQNPDGSILSVYYYNLFGKYYIGGSTWNP
jgi:hypothetical protein